MISHSAAKPWDHCIVANHIYWKVFQEPTDSCIALFTVLCGVSQRTGAGSGMCFPTPQQRSSDHLFPPSVDHKTLTRMCVKRSIVLCSPLLCRPLSFSVSLFSCVFISLPHLLCDSSSRSGSLAQFLSFWVQERTVCAPGRCGNAGLQHSTGLKSRAAPAVITFGRVCACVELNQCCHND